MFRNIVTFLICSLLFACHIQKEVCPCDANETLIIENVELGMIVQVSRNMMSQIGSSDSSPVFMVVRVFTTNGEKIPSNIKLDRYVVRLIEEDGFARSFTEIRPAEDGKTIELIARDLPNWEKGKQFDVAVEFSDEAGNLSYIKIDAVTVNAVY